MTSENERALGEFLAEEGRRCAERRAKFTAEELSQRADPHVEVWEQRQALYKKAWEIGLKAVKEDLEKLKFPCER